jgi:FeS assembly SUF system protein
MNEMEDKIVTMLKSIYDPEIPVDIYELGLIYEVKIDKENQVQIEMTLTSPNCPVAESLPKEVEDKVETIEEVVSCKVNIVFDPPWDKDMMSETINIMKKRIEMKQTMMKKKLWMKHSQIKYHHLYYMLKK